MFFVALECSGVKLQPGILSRDLLVDSGEEAASVLRELLELL